MMLVLSGTSMCMTLNHAYHTFLSYSLAMYEIVALLFISFFSSFFNFSVFRFILVNSVFSISCSHFAVCFFFSKKKKREEVTSNFKLIHIRKLVRCFQFYRALFECGINIYFLDHLILESLHCGCSKFVDGFFVAVVVAMDIDSNAYFSPNMAIDGIEHVLT